MGTVAAIGYLDHLTGTEISFSIFYLPPAAFAFWQGGVGPGLATVLAGATAWLIADLTAGHIYTHPVIPYWNALMRGMIFFVVGMLLQRLRRSLERESMLATRDALTGIGNWRHFEAVARREIGRARRSGTSLSVAYIDLDNFKMVNDRIRTLLEQTLVKGQWPATLSVGLVTFTLVPATIDQMIKTADDLMYSVKKGGKNSLEQRVI